MQFTHEVTLTAQAPWRDIWAEWNDVRRLPRLLSHVCDAVPLDAEDTACFTVLLEGRHIEFAAERTMCADKTLCWQSLGPHFLYLLTLRLETPRRGPGAALTLTVAYDPPGFLPDLAESLGLSRRFAHQLDTDFRRYVRSLEACCVSELTSPE